MDITYTELLVTLPLKEYNELKEFKENMEKGKFVEYTVTDMFGFGGSSSHQSIRYLDKDDIIENALKKNDEKISELKIRHLEEINKLNQEIENLRNQNLSLLAKKTKKRTKKFIFF